MCYSYAVSSFKHNVSQGFVGGTQNCTRSSPFQNNNDNKMQKKKKDHTVNVIIFCSDRCQLNKILAEFHNDLV